MTRILGSVLAGLLALQTGLPSLGLEAPLVNVAALVVGVAVAAITFYLRAPAEGRPN